MRMEELSEARYLKRADSVESYLLGLVEEYFKTKIYTPSSSMERVIERCLARIDEELEYDGVGVTGIKLPGDEEPRTGTVDIDLELLGGEPIIAPKKSAFNVNFGTEIGTACEGNDPRLNNKRMPLEHEHLLSDIQGLEGRLSTIDGKISRLLEMAHDHWNKSILDILTYSGSKERIDLADYEDLESKCISHEDAIRQEVSLSMDTIQDIANDLAYQIQSINGIVNEVYQYIEERNAELLGQARTYSDQNRATALAECEAMLTPYAKREDLIGLNEQLKAVYFPIGSVSFDTVEINGLEQGEAFVYSVPITQAILNEIAARGQTLEKCLFRFTISYTSNDNHRCHQHMPYIMLSEDGEKTLGTYRAYVDFNTKSLVAEANCYEGDGYTRAMSTSTVSMLVLSKKADPLGIEGAA